MNVSNCKDCKFVKTCPTIPVFVDLIKGYAIEEGKDLLTMSSDERAAYINKMLDEYVKYLKGGITPGLIAYTRDILAK